MCNGDATVQQNSGEDATALRVRIGAARASTAARSQGRNLRSSAEIATIV
jgi:hypothetical protein